MPQALLPPQHCEIVFGFVYPVDTNVDPVLQAFRDCLNHYKYKPNDVRISEQLRSLDFDISFDAASEYQTANALMDAGNLARSTTNEDSILAVMVISNIAETREADEKKHPKARERVAHLVRSFKRPEEVLLFRDVYRTGFFLVAIANNNNRHTYLIDQLGMTPDEADSLVQRDAKEDDPHGQRMRDTFSLADVFIQADEGHYLPQVSRFLELVFGLPFVTPSREEHAMFLAYASAARSAQLGRQVGAAIASPEGEVVAVGMNEVPSPEGGQYWEGDHGDARDHKKGIDSNTEQRGEIAKSIYKNLNNSILNTDRLRQLVQEVFLELKIDPQDLNLGEAISRTLDGTSNLLDEAKTRDAIAESDLKQITEYGRAVHGEMDAILTCARLGISVKGKHLFVTTFPCHNCTRHIIASGIEKVYYIEPYPKSKAPDLHSDAIRFDDSEVEGENRIPFVPFVGVGPRRYLDLFSLQLSAGREIVRKDRQSRPNLPEKPNIPPRVQMVPLGFLEREERLQRLFKGIVLKLQEVDPESDTIEHSREHDSTDN